MKMEKENYLMSKLCFLTFIQSSSYIVCLFLSSNELDERSYATKRSSVNHRTYVNPSIRRDKERSFSSCKYQILFFLQKLILFIY